MEALQSADVDAITKMLQFTPTMHRKVYPAIDPKNPQNSAAGKNVLVTGATRGIGKAIALSWAEAGANAIVITGRAKDLLAKVTDEIRQISPKTKVVAVPANAGSEQETADVWTKAAAEVGIIDVLVCNAGVNPEIADGFPATGKIAPSKWWSIMQINILGYYLHEYNFIQQFTTAGKEPTGTVIIIASAMAFLTVPGNSAYTLSKHVNIRQAGFLNAEYPGVRSYSVHPGMAPTDMQDPQMAAMALDPPELTGAFTLYLSTPRAGFLSGKFVSVNWDVEEMEKHSKEILEKKLLEPSVVEAKLGPEGHPFEVLV